MAQIPPSWRDRIASLLGVSAYQGPPLQERSIDDPEVEAARARLNGQLTPFPMIQTRWFLSDLEAAQQAANQGDLSYAARLYRAMRADGVFAGHLSARTGRAVRLAKKFTGDPAMISALEGRDGARSVFDDMFPPSELEALADDGLMLGVGVGELMPVQGRAYPVLVRLDPEWLRYRWSENRWYYQSTVGQLPITPGDGRWVLHAPGGRIAPWQRGLWNSCGHAFITKVHAQLHQANWEAKLANPARAAVSPLASTEGQRQGFLQRLIAWGVNTVFELPPGWDVKLIESNGHGFESFVQTIERADREYMIALAGQVVTTDGGAGFANADIHKSIRADLIQGDGDALAHTINTQTLPPWIAARWGVEALEDGALVEWDVRPPSDMKAEAESFQATAKAIVDLGSALRPYGRAVDVDELASRGGVPTVEAKQPPVRLEIATGDAAKVVRVDEARAAQGLAAIGDDRGLLTIAELGAGGAAPGSPEAPESGESSESSAPGADASDAPSGPAFAERLAAKMSALGLTECPHGAKNRCRICGVERDYEPSRGPDGTVTWGGGWTPIGASAGLPSAPKEAA